MENKIIEELVKRLSRGDFQYQVKDYLTEQGISEEESETYVAKANEKIAANKLETLPKKKMLIFAGLAVFAVIIFILFFFIIPSKGFSATTVLSVLGAALFAISATYAALSFNSWKEKNIKEEIATKRQFDHTIPLLIMGFPALIMFFVFSYKMEQGVDNLLKQTQIETTGKIISGSSVTIKGVNVTTVTIEFKTKGGNLYRVKEDVSGSEFRKFYEGQRVSMVYSSEDPNNIDLLTSKSAISKYKDSEERMIKPDDLLKLLNTPDKDVLPYLNKVTYGWEYLEESENWINEEKNLVFSKTPLEVQLISMNSVHMAYQELLEKVGFSRIKKEGENGDYMANNKNFESDEHYANLSRMQMENMVYYFPTIGKK